MITHDAPKLDDATAASAALAAVEALGVGGTPQRAEPWPTDMGNRHLAAGFSGAARGALHLVVDADTADRLLADPSTVPAVLGPALTALGIDTDAIDADPFAPATTTPNLALRVDRDGDEPVWVGFSIDSGPEPAQSFEPSPMRPAGAPQTSGAPVGSLAMLSDVDMEVTVELGRTKLPIRELLALQPGMVVEIDRAAGSPIDVLVNGRLIACGEVVVIDEEFGVRITEIVSNGGAN